MKRRRRGSRAIAAAFACFAVGLATGWWLHANGPLKPAALRDAVPSVGAPAPPANAAVDAVPRLRAGEPAEAGGPTPIAPPGLLHPPAHDDAVHALRDRHLRLPLDDVRVESMKGSFEEQRSGNGGHKHEAADLLAPRNTPIRAVDDGTVAKLFLSKAGGRTIYQFDENGRFCYYYAHLEKYAWGLKEGQRVTRGDVIGYVGTSGNAPPNTPHLHFAVFELGPERRWWQGAPIDPYLVFKD